MLYKIEENNVIIDNIINFNIAQILDSGQCFRYEEININEYLIIAYNKILRVKQVESRFILFNIDEKEYLEIWKEYFSLDNKYDKIINELKNKDDVIKNAIEYANGIRILRQDLWEIIITFIISQNNNIKRIKQNVNTLSINYGKKIGEYNNKEYYSFPTIDELKDVTEDELRKHKLGFRAKYIKDAIDKIVSKEIEINNLYSMDTENAKNELLKIKGIGNKVADCILLFGLHKYDVFPTDTWINKIMIKEYIKKEVKIEEVTAFAIKYFGEYASYAQQYLFHYARKNLK